MPGPGFGGPGHGGPGFGGPGRGGPGFGGPGRGGPGFGGPGFGGPGRGGPGFGGFGFFGSPLGFGVFGRSGRAAGPNINQDENTSGKSNNLGKYGRMFGPTTDTNHHTLPSWKYGALLGGVVIALVLLGRFT